MDFSLLEYISIVFSSLPIKLINHNCGPAADPGFLRVRRQPERGAPTYYLAKMCWKLYENEENWTEGGTRVQKFTM